MRLYDMLYEALSNIATTVDKPTTSFLQEKLEQLKSIYSPMCPGQEVDDEEILRKVLKDVVTWGGGSTTLEDNRGHEEWLSNVKADISWNYWNRYKAYLKKFEHYPLNVINSIDEQTDNILRLLESPQRPGAWDRRGMVVGNIQSGKTSNYTGLICKAVDAGYKVIIVLAGLNNDLRSQTQKRLDKGFLGRDTSKKKDQDQTSSKIGAGLIPGFKEQPITAVTSSDSNGDYKNSVHHAVTIMPGGTPVIAVVKKNVTPLSNLLEWFQSINLTKRISDVPLLLIDDEADNASIDTKAAKKLGMDAEDIKEQDPTRINGLIRKILKCFDQSAYIGYTATPFANIFIYPDDGNSDEKEFGEDLYPRSFIVNLHAPSNYMGPDTVFGLYRDRVSGIDAKDPLPLVRVIDDYQDVFPEKHKKDLEVKVLPNSLYTAIYEFIIGCAVRSLRGQELKHKSMLIHVTRFVAVQGKIVDVIKEEMRNIVNELGLRTGPQYDKLIADMKQLWVKDFVPTTNAVKNTLADSEIKECTWEDIEPLLFKQASKIEIKAVNGKAADGGLNYDQYEKTGMSVIAVGGNKLSRGLTLEGLMVSYYTRVSKMYDTLLQMGRWFGFRSGYEDVCRLFTSEQLTSWYQHIAVVNEEFRQELDEMASLPDATPENYGLKVRTHPDGMIITALNKMRNSEKRKVTYAGRLLQIAYFYKKNNVNDINLAFTKQWIERLGKPAPAEKRFRNNIVWLNQSPDTIIDFLSAIKIHQSCFDASPKIVTQYIANQVEDGELINWTVGLVSVNDQPQKQYPDLFTMHITDDITIGLPWRSDSGAVAEGIDDGILRLPNRNLITLSDQAIDLTEDEWNAALADTIEHPIRQKTATSKKEIKEPSPFWVRQNRSKKRGLLLIYIFRSGHKNDISNPYTNIYVGYAVSFPASNTAREVEYKVDEVWMANHEDEDF